MRRVSLVSIFILLRANQDQDWESKGMAVSLECSEARRNLGWAPSPLKPPSPSPLSFLSAYSGTQMLRRGYS